MKKLLIISLMFFLLLPVTDAQLWKARRYEAVFGVGTTQFFGDIGGFSNDENILGIKDFTFLQTRFNLNTGMRYRISEDFAVRLSLVFGMFHSTDARGSNENRGFESGTMFFEPALLGEYYFIKNKAENSFVFLKGNTSLLKSAFQAMDFYAFAGAGGLAFHVNPNDKL